MLFLLKENSILLATTTWKARNQPISIVNMIIALDFIFSPIFFFTRNGLTHLMTKLIHINCMKFYYLYEKIIFICE